MFQPEVWPHLATCLLVVAGCASATEQNRERLVSAYAGLEAPPEQAAPLSAPLQREALIRAVLSVNPSVAAAEEGFRAALARYPQETALDDPMLTYSLGPISLFEGRFGQTLELSQRFPFFGKLELRGQVANAGAEAAKEDIRTVRLELGLTASLLYDDFFVIDRALEINASHQALIRELAEAATSQYVAGAASQQDPLQAEVELTHLEHENVVLDMRRAVVVARLNALLHRAPELSIPAPPDQMTIPTESSTVSPSRALERRPELAAQRARVEEKKAGVALAKREYFPDFSVMTGYNSMWGATPHRWMVGVGLNVPIQLGRRAAAVEQAEAELAREGRTLDRLTDDTLVSIREAGLLVEKARHVVHLYATRLLPAARDQVEAARAGFVAGANSFSALIDAEKNLRSVELERERANAELCQSLALLARASGRIPWLGEED